MGSSSPRTFGVAEVLDIVESAVASAFPGPVWVRGEVSGFSRSARGAGFFRLVDTGSSEQVIDVAARGRVMGEIDLALERAGVGTLRNGVEARVRGLVGISRNRSQVSLSLLEVDPEFIAGRLAIDREEILRRLRADGSLVLNKELPLPLVPLRLGLVASRGTAAHADFIGQLNKSGYRFRVRTVQATVQGEAAPESVARALRRVATEPVDAVVVIRGGGAKLDLLAFDSELVARTVASMPVPVVAGIGHATDRTIVDEVASVSVKTPTAAGEWVVSRVADFARRVDLARAEIRDRSRDALRRAHVDLGRSAMLVGAGRAVVDGQRHRLESTAASIADGARRAVRGHRRLLSGMADTFDAVGVEPTLRRGFALVLDADGKPVVRAKALHTGDRVMVRFADGSVKMAVEETP